jgi:hypothetical protein
MNQAPGILERITVLDFIIKTSSILFLAGLPLVVFNDVTKQDKKKM